MDFKIVFLALVAAVTVIELSEAQVTSVSSPFGRSTSRNGGLRRFGRRRNGRRRFSRRRTARRRGFFRRRLNNGNNCTRRQRRRGLCNTTIPRPSPTPSPAPPQASSTSTAISLPPVDTGNNDMNSVARSFLNNDNEMIPNLVQLVFHSCIGGCDGCINFDEADNKGLRESYPTIKRFCEQRLSSLSLADCIVFMASKAVEMGMAKSDGIRGISIPFSRGRQTCDDPDNYNKHFEFPKGDADDALPFLMREFGVSRKEAIALMGAHSLGRCRQRNSGFDGKWDNTELVFDNGYYKSMIGTDWVIREMGGTSQWTMKSSNNRMMLHADMALVRNLGLSNNKPTCTRARSCPRNNNDANQVSDYAKNEQTFANDFVSAFGKMVSKRP